MSPRTADRQCDGLRAGDIIVQAPKELLGDFARCLRRGNNTFDHLRLGIRVCVHVGPLFRGQFALRLLVASSVVAVSAQAVPEGQDSLNLRATDREDVDVDVLFRSPEHSVLVPIRLPHPQDIPRRLQLWQICELIRRIRGYDKNINDGLGGQTRHGCRPHMLDSQGGAAKRVGDDPGVRLKLLRPIRVVVENPDLAFFDAPDQSCFQWFICHNSPFASGWSGYFSKLSLITNLWYADHLEL